MAVLPKSTTEVRFSTRLLTDLSISNADESLIHQLVCFGVSGLPLHDVALSSLISQRDGGDLQAGRMIHQQTGKVCLVGKIRQTFSSFLKTVNS